MKTLKVMLLVMFIAAVASPVYAEGCTPGFWKNNLEGWLAYEPFDLFSDVFGVGSDNPLMQVLKTGGGGEEALARHAVAAILNASNPDIDYELTEGGVIATVQEAYATGEFEDAKDLLEELNECGCPEEDD